MDRQRLQFTLVRLDDAVSTGKTTTTSSSSINPTSLTNDTTNQNTCPPKLTLNHYFNAIESSLHSLNDCCTSAIQYYYDHRLLTNQQPCNVDTIHVNYGSSWEQQRQRIMRYIQEKDQHIAFVSLLLKSMAFHVSLVVNKVDDYQRPVVREIFSNYTQQNLGCKPIVVLPRTDYDQPYIPPLMSYNASSLNTTLPDPISNHGSNGIQNTHFPFSISHQYPFIGMIQLLSSSYEESNSELNVSSMTYVGLDIVVFDHYNPKIYDSEIEFINVFQDNFTRSEWEAIMDLYQPNLLNVEQPQYQQAMLNEFYIRWSIKEAYTKALGRGMSINFASFETSLIAYGFYDDVNKTEATTIFGHQCNSIWNWIEATSFHSKIGKKIEHQQLFVTVGTVSHIMKPDSNQLIKPELQNESNIDLASKEQYLFYFYPLYGSNKEGNQNKSPNRPNFEKHEHVLNIEGCACICVGPLNYDGNTNNENIAELVNHRTFPIDIEFTNIPELCAFHGIQLPDD